MNHFDKIPKLISDGRIEDALDLLSSSATGHKDIAKDVVHLQGRWAEFSKNRTRGVLSHAEENLQYAKITASVLDLSERLDKRLGESSGGTTLPKIPLRGGMLLAGVLVAGLLLWQISQWIGAKAFDVNISLQPRPGLVNMPLYPPLKDASLYLRIGGEWRAKKLGALDDAGFQNIPPEYDQKYVQARLEAKYWKLQSDSVLLKGPSQTLWIVPDGSLSRIEGKVFDLSTAKPVAGVILNLSELTALSDSNGHFIFDSIPLHLQQQMYEVFLRKNGYKTRKDSAPPATQQLMEIPLEKDK